MPSAKFTVGESEKHWVFVQSSYWTGQFKVDVDGKRVVDSYTLGFEKSVEFSVGDVEKHLVKLDVEYNNAFTYFIDGTKIRRVRVR